MGWAVLQTSAVLCAGGNFTFAQVIYSVTQVLCPDVRWGAVSLRTAMHRAAAPAVRV